jgi:nitroreductase
VELIEALRTTGAVREFMPGPVPDDVLVRVLDAARFAPNGGNRQAWRVIVVKDPETRRGLRDLYMAGWDDYRAQVAAGVVPFSPIGPRDAADAKDVPPRGDFADHFDEVPALLVVLADLNVLAAVDRDLDRYGLVGGASVYPFVWSLLLAAHAEGLGGVITTMVVASEPEVKALLGVPANFAVACVVVLGYPVRRARRLTRRPVDSFTALDRFAGPPLGA